MDKPLRCDQCGRDLTEEDFETGRAVRDRVDVFCAECASMYEDDDRKRKMRDRMAQAAVARPKGRRGATTAMRARTPGRRFSGRGTQGMRARTPRSSPAAFYIIAGVIAVLSLVVIMAVLMSRKKSSRPPDGPRRPPRSVGTGTTTTQGTDATGKASPDRPAGNGTVTLPVTVKTPSTTKDDGTGKHGTSLFGPGGTLDDPGK